MARITYKEYLKRGKLATPSVKEIGEEVDRAVNELKEILNPKN